MTKKEVMRKEERVRKRVDVWIKKEGKRKKKSIDNKERYKRKEWENVQ